MADICAKADSLCPDRQWVRAFVGSGRGEHAETAQSSLTFIFKLVTNGLTYVISIALGAVNL